MDRLRARAARDYVANGFGIMIIHSRETCNDKSDDLVLNIRNRCG